jgi:hypothetical protein
MCGGDLVPVEAKAKHPLGYLLANGIIVDSQNVGSFILATVQEGTR